MTQMSNVDHGNDPPNRKTITGRSASSDVMTLKFAVTRRMRCVMNDGFAAMSYQWKEELGEDPVTNE